MISKFKGLLCAAIAGLWLVVSPAQAQPAANESVREVQVAVDRFERSAALPSWVEAHPSVPQTQDKSPVVALLADTQLLAGAEPAYHVRRVWLAGATSALTELGNYSIDFNPAYQRARLHTLRVLRGGEVLDKLASARITFLQRETGLEQGLYSGRVNASILIDDLRVGDLLDVAYTVTGENPVLEGKFFSTASWDQSVRTELRRVTLLHPATRAVTWKMLGDLDTTVVQPHESAAGGMRKLRWEARGLQRIDNEKGTPGHYAAFRYLQFSEYRSWSDVTSWADGLFKADGATDPEVTKLISRFSALPTADERVSAALGWVQDEIRYFSLALGESSHRPAAPAVTLRRRWGDCKDKSVLLIQLLRGMGIPAQPVLVTTLGLGASKHMPTPTAFDHVIVRAETNGREYFLDPARQGQSGKLDTMGQYWEDAEVLVIAPGNSAFTIVKSPNYAAISRNELHEKIALPKFGEDGVITAKMTWTGTNAEYRRLAFGRIPREILHKALLETYERRYPGAQLAGDLEISDDSLNNVLSLGMKVKVPALAVASGTSWGVRYGASNLDGLLPLPPAAQRRHPFQLPGIGRNRYAVEIEFPSNVSVMMDPTTRNVRYDTFEFIGNKSFRGNQAAASYDINLLRRQVEPAQVADYMASVRRAVEGDTGVFMVAKEHIKSSGGPLGLGATPSLKRMMESRLADTIDKMGKAIASGRLTGDDLAEAHCDRADALVDLGKHEEALKDAQAAIRINPNFARAYQCRGSAYFGAGEYARSVADYTKALTLAPEAEHSNIYLRRGQSRFYAGQLAPAADDFAKSVSSGAHGGDSALYAEMWRVWTLRRLGRQPTAEQANMASANPRGDWPRPALAMLHGLITVEQMLATLDSKKGDDKEMGLTEAYFYAGQWHYFQGDKAKAAEYFRKTRDKGVILYTEYVAAGIELRLMEAGN
jgi:lipoprotein NlpI/transglutaminase-like putative cysteine protease